jgi:D-alanyl-D-alanine carboxypeptidase
MRNHNHLLGRIDGVDGIKTGYTRMSGFNLITSVRRGPRHVVAVVFGGRSASQRDARMVSLIDANFDDASTKRTAPKVADAAKTVRVAATEDAPAVPAARTASAGPLVLTPIRRETPSKAETTAAIPVPRPAPGSTDPIKPLPVKTLSVKPGAAQATFAPVALLSPMPVTTQASAARAETRLPPPPPGARPGVLGVLPANAAPAAEQKAPVQVASAEPKAVPASAAPVSSAPHTRTGWMVQVGAFDDEAEARQRLDSARSKASRLLGKAEPFTESVAKGDKTLFRARFAGLDQDEAEAACKQLKKNEIVCMTIRN